MSLPRCDQGNGLALILERGIPDWSLTLFAKAKALLFSHFKQSLHGLATLDQE